MLQNLRPLREAAGLKQSDLAEMSGVSQGHISKLEIGDESPTLKTLQKLADALGISIQDLVAAPAKEVRANV